MRPAPIRRTAPFGAAVIMRLLRPARTFQDGGGHCLAGDRIDEHVQLFRGGAELGRAHRSVEGAAQSLDALLGHIGRRQDEAPDVRCVGEEAQRCDLLLVAAELRERDALAEPGELVAAIELVSPGNKGLNELPMGFDCEYFEPVGKNRRIL